MQLEDQYSEFCEACDELRDSKIILADSKVSKLLRSIVASPYLVEKVGDALVGYNLESEFSKYVGKDLEGNDKIELPKEPYRVIAFVFSLLTQFDTNELDLQEFVHQYFVADNLMESFERFNEELISPFKQYLCNWVGYKEGEDKDDNDINTSAEEEEDDILDEEITFQAKEETEVDEVQLLFNDLVMIINQIKETVNSDTKIKQDRLDELNITLDALLIVFEMKNFRIMNALLISLNNMLAPIKSVRFYSNELQNRLSSFYENYI